LMLIAKDAEFLKIDVKAEANAMLTEMEGV
jgi:hypothetical protein